MKQLLVVMLTLILLQSVKAQKNIEFYTFQESAGTFSSIASTGTSLTPGDWDDGYTPVTAIGFNFRYGNADFSQFSVNTNGTISLGTATTSSSSNNLASASVVNQIAPLWDDLIFRATTLQKGIFYQLSGDEGSHVLTIEFQNVGRYMNSGEGTSSGTVSFQVQLFESDNSVAIVYGNMSGASDWSVNFSASIGINALVEAETQFVSVTPNAAGASVSTTESNNTISKEQILAIAEGTTYTFSPPVIATDIDVELFSINTPQSNFLTDNETVSITLKNLGIEVPEGLTLHYTITDVETGLELGSTVTEGYLNYPLTVQSTVDFTFNQPVDLIENKEYEIFVSIEIENDVNLENNHLSKVFKGVILNDVLFSQSQIATQAGVGANGANVSEVQTSLGFTDFGVNGDWEVGFINADNFTVPEGETWYVDAVTVYSWQTGSTLNSTMEYIDFKVWDNAPGEVGATVLYDFSEQNMLSGSRWSGIYRVTDQDLTNTQRPIMYSACVVNEEQTMVFPSGTYWLGWSGLGSISNQGTYIPPVTLVNEVTTGDAWHLGYAGWVPWTDEGTTTVQGMPFNLHGTKTSIIDFATENRVTVYPVPVEKFLTVDCASSCTFSLFDYVGNTILKLEISGQGTIDTGFLPAGIYYVRISTAGMDCIRKIVKL